MTSSPSSSSATKILKSVKQVREWREEQRKLGKDVGFVPTMGALHQGHLSLVKASLAQNSSTIISIFVNPAQFAPHEDLATYPRPLENDLKLLETLPEPGVAAVFLPPVEEIYQGGITTDVKSQRGAFVEVKGVQDGMEGGSRPGFFRGVATVVTKLFNIVQPTRAYFGQKDIQQAILLRRMLSDLHMTAPTPSNLVILPTYRASSTSTSTPLPASPSTDSAALPDPGLALSSRNAYLSVEEMRFSKVLIDALSAAREVWNSQRSGSSGGGDVVVKDVLNAARDSVKAVEEEAKKAGVNVKGMYFQLNDPEELWDLEDKGKIEKGKGAILSGAVMLGRTRLIDNIVFEYEL
ncbi:Pantoate-beta-alanine ligase [Meredithblackwellia eburnea MCA 4105]